MNNALKRSEGIRSKIHTLRGVQVMLDSDLAELYGVEVRVLNQAVKRNIERFPKHFMFQLTPEEFETWRLENTKKNNERPALKENNLTSQNVTSKHGGRRHLPYAFTEQGISMLSGVLKSSIAIKISIQIIDTFVAMRKFISSNARIFQRLDRVELKQIEHDKNFKEVFKALETKKPQKGIFYDGQVFDAHVFVSELIRDAKKSIILIDNYVDESTLTLFTKRKNKVKVSIYTKNVSQQLQLDIKKFNAQYTPIKIKEFTNAHDRFMIIDGTTIYHLGASLKDLGKKWFAFSKFEKEAIKMLGQLPPTKARLQEANTSRHSLT